MSGDERPSTTASGELVQRVPAIVVLGTGTLISHGFGLALVPAMLPRISAELGAGYDVLGAAVATGLIAYTVGAIGAARIAERLPNRGTLLATYLVSALGLLIAGTAHSVAAVTAAVTILGFAAPVSWTLTLHVAAVTTAPRQRAMVMATASGGAALGVLINGVLVQTSASMHSWRTSFFIAAGLAVLPIVGGLIVYRRPIAPPAAATSDSRRWRRILADPGGRVVVYAGLVAGIAGFPFNVFLTATALDELGVSSLAAAALWWLIGTLGMIAGPILGGYGDRAGPLRALTLGAVLYAAGLSWLIVQWSYVGLVVAVFGYSFMNYPIWGLVGAVAGHRFTSAGAVRAVSLGLVAASLGGAVGNAAAGWWIDATASFRIPVVAMTAIAWALVVWYVSVAGRAGIDQPGRPRPASQVG